MEELWARSEATVREVQEALNARAEKVRAYTTVLTVMTRLDGKGLLVRRRAGRLDVYSPAMSRDAYLQARAEAEVGHWSRVSATSRWPTSPAMSPGSTRSGWASSAASPRVMTRAAATRGVRGRGVRRHGVPARAAVRARRGALPRRRARAASKGCRAASSTGAGCCCCRWRSSTCWRWAARCAAPARGVAAHRRVLARMPVARARDCSAHRRSRSCRARGRWRSAPGCCTRACTSPRGRCSGSPRDELAAVVEHEAHHAGRRDPLRILVARAIGEAYALTALPRREQALAELAADAAAARRRGAHRWPRRCWPSTPRRSRPSASTGSLAHAPNDEVPRALVAGAGVVMRGAGGADRARGLLHPGFCLPLASAPAWTLCAITARFVAMAPAWLGWRRAGAFLRGRSRPSPPSCGLAVRRDLRALAVALEAGDDHRVLARPALDGRGAAGGDRVDVSSPAPASITVRGRRCGCCRRRCRRRSRRIPLPCRKSLPSPPITVLTPRPA